MSEGYSADVKQKMSKQERLGIAAGITLAGTFVVILVGGTGAIVYDGIQSHERAPAVKRGLLKEIDAAGFTEVDNLQVSGDVSGDNNQASIDTLHAGICSIPNVQLSFDVAGGQFTDLSFSAVAQTTGQGKFEQDTSEVTFTNAEMYEEALRLNCFPPNWASAVKR